jgi:hypothetical protein
MPERKFSLSDVVPCTSEVSERSEIIYSMTNNQEIINGWDNDANLTIKNWYHGLKEYLYIYKFILDENYRLSTNLSILSIIFSTGLSIFSGIKSNFNLASSSDIVGIIGNLIVSGIILSSKKIINVDLNETIRIFIEKVDRFMGTIYAQIALSPVYRMNASQFFENNKKEYTRIIMLVPNVSLHELEKAKQSYQKVVMFSLKKYDNC